MEYCTFSDQNFTAHTRHSVSYLNRPEQEPIDMCLVYNLLTSMAFMRKEKVSQFYFIKLSKTTCVCCSGHVSTFYKPEKMRVGRLAIKFYRQCITCISFVCIINNGRWLSPARMCVIEMKMHDVKTRVWTILFAAFPIGKKNNTKNTRDSDQTPLAGRQLNQSQATGQC